MRTSGQVSVGQEEQDVRFLVAVHGRAGDGEVGICRPQYAVRVPRTGRAPRDQMLLDFALSELQLALPLPPRLDSVPS